MLYIVFMLQPNKQRTNKNIVVVNDIPQSYLAGASDSRDTSRDVIDWKRGRKKWYAFLFLCDVMAYLDIIERNHNSNISYFLQGGWQLEW